MRRTTGTVVNWTLVNVVLTLACWILFSTVAAKAQQGQNAVYYSGIPTNSPGFIDASMFATSPPPPVNFCAVLNYVLADEITVSAPCERVDLEALKATKARRKGAER